MKPWVMALALSLCFIAGGAALAQEAVIDCYVLDPCGGCASEVKGCGDCTLVNETLAAVMDALTVPAKVSMHNLNLPFDLTAYREVVSRLGATEYQLPLYVLNGEIAISGEGALERLAVAAALNQSPEETPRPTIRPRNDAADLTDGDSVVLYFYKTWCPYCAELSPLLDALPQEITLPDGSRSRVVFQSFDKEKPEDMAVVQAYYDRMNIPEDRQYVPMIIIGDKALFLKEEIVPGLLPALLAGEGRLTPIYAGGED